jgi:hypothetical protein
MSFPHGKVLVGMLVAVLALSCGEATMDGEGAADVPPPPPEDEPFDAEASRELAERWIGVAEEDLEETVMFRLARRGEEFFPGTMDLRPGRFNVELDEDDQGVYRVTRIVIETEEGESLVVE